MKKMSVSLYGYGRFLSMIMVQCVVLVLGDESKRLHVVGDGLGWTVPQTNDPLNAYTIWASNNTFFLGDVLTFNFVTGRHDVVKVTKDTYESCNLTNNNSIGIDTLTITIGPTNITLSAIGDHYYICSIGRHCHNGQKLAVTVGSPPPSMASMPPCEEPPPPPHSYASSILATFILPFFCIVLGIIH